MKIHGFMAIGVSSWLCLSAPSLIGADEILFEEGFNDNGEGTRYTVEGGFVSEVADHAANGVSADQVGPVYWGLSSDVSIVGVPGPTAERRAVISWYHELTAADVTADALEMLDSTIAWLTRDKANLRVLFSPAPMGAGDELIVARLTAKGATVTGDDVEAVIPPAANYDLVIHSSQGAQPSRFTNYPVPYLTFNGPDHDDELVGTIGLSETRDIGDITISAPEHPAAGGKTGSFRFFTGEARVDFPGPQVPDGSTVIATYPIVDIPPVTSLADVEAMVAGTVDTVVDEGTIPSADLESGDAGNFSGGNGDNPVPGGPIGSFATVSTGSFTVKTSGTYGIALWVAGGGRLRIDVNRNGLDAGDTIITQDQVVMVDDLIEGSTSYADVTLAAGDYDFEWVAYSPTSQFGSEVYFTFAAGANQRDPVDDQEKWAPLADWEAAGIDILPLNLNGEIAVTKYEQPSQVIEERPLIVAINGPDEGGQVFGGGAFIDFEGSGFFAGSALNKFNGEVDPKTVTLNPVNLAGQTGLKLKLLLAATTLDFETSDRLDILIDPNNSGTFQILGHFTAPTTNDKFFSDGTTNLNIAFQEVVYDIPEGATNAVIKIEAVTTWWNEVVGIDHIRIVKEGEDVPVATGLAPPSGVWTTPQSLASFDALGDSDKDVTFRTYIDFEAKADGERELIWESGGATIGYSVVYEAGNKIVARADGNGGFTLVTIEHVLTADQLAAGELEVVWTYDVDDGNGASAISLYIDGVQVATGSDPDLGGDWSGTDGAAFGVASASIAGDGNNVVLTSIAFASGKIGSRGLEYYPNTLYVIGVADTDGDGIDDAYELALGGLGLLSGDGDADNDGATDPAEVRRGTDPNKADTDGDGLNDGVETSTGVFVSNTDTGTNPLSPDGDNDGVSDGDEVAGGTDPFNKDTDGDGFDDGVELAEGTDPTDSNSIPDLLATIALQVNTIGSFGTMQSNGWDLLDATFQVSIDFEAKADGEREVIWESGGGTVGFSLVYEAGDKLVLRAAGNGGNTVAVLDYVLTSDQLAAGELGLTWTFDVDDGNGLQVIALYINEVQVGSLTEDIDPDWSGSNGASFGAASDNLAAAGGNTPLTGVDFTSGTINVAKGLVFYSDFLFTADPAPGGGDGKQVIWISEVETASGQEFKDLLAGQGHTVTEMFVSDPTAAEQATINAADVVVISRKTNSGTYNNQTWDETITAPLILMTPYLSRSNRWAWLAGDGLVDDTPATIAANAAAHPIFEGLTITDGATGPWHTAVDRGTSLATDAVANGGTLIASSPDGAIVVAEWPTDTVAVGPRLLFAAGSREPDGLAIGEAGKFNLTADGEKAFLNAIAYLTGGGDSGSAALVDLDASGLAAGAIASWTNAGSLGGEFQAFGDPMVEMINGVNAVTFDGTGDYFEGPASTPEIEGANPRSIIAWVYNPELASEETVISWGKRGGPDGTNMSFNHGFHNNFGAVGHWGGDGPDIGWNHDFQVEADAPNTPGDAEAGTWTHIAYTQTGSLTKVFTNGTLSNSEAADINTHPGLGILVGAQRESDGVAVTDALKASLSIAKVQIFVGALSDEAILADFENSAESFGRQGGGPSAGTPEITGISFGAGGVNLLLPAGVTADIEHSIDLIQWSVIASGISDSFDDTDAGRTSASAGYYRAVVK